MRNAVICIAVAFVINVCCGREASSQTWDFEKADLGKPPSGWTVEKTGDGEGSIWKILEDKSAPSGPRILAQVAKGPRPLFNLCIADEPKLADVELSVAF